MSENDATVIDESDIAVIGMASHLPGARTPDEFWRDLRDGVESIEQVADEDLRKAGVSEALLANPRYVKATAKLENMEHFDAEFFGFSPKEAAIMDPQHRHLITCAWEALDDAGHPPERFEGAIGVYAGCGMNAYMMFNLLTNPNLMESVGLFLIRHTGNDKDFLATRISYLLNLTGPSVNIQTACSTSLVAIHSACQSLLNGECDMALAGGVTIEIPHGRGYLYEEGEILSPDGHCRAFDHRSEGTVFGSGAGLVVLRRLADAIEDRDHIYAVVKGSAINNDGSNKVGYLAPSVDGQAAVIAEALALAGVESDSISYVEAHGTGTPVGDPIEIAAITQAFAKDTDRTGYCGIGSVKTNIGHLDTAAGVASFIKVCQALRHGELPPSLGFEAPNPNIDFANSPFYVNTELREWRGDGAPRRAGVSALGVGGTNAYVILEEAPEPPGTSAGRHWQLLGLSARNRESLEETTRALADHLRANPEQPLADVAYTLQVGRRAFDHRRTVLCRSHEEAIRALEGDDATLLPTRQVHAQRTSIAFMFPGGGAQYPQMGRELYETEPVYREQVDRGLSLMREHHGVDLHPLMFPEEGRVEAAEREFQRPSLQLPAIFIVEHALAQLWMSWGVEPNALIGHSMGENTAACVAGVMSFEDALGLVALRGQLFERVPSGGMLSVPLSGAELTALLGDELHLASVNAPSLSVASGPTEALERLEGELAARGVEATRIKIDIAAHSSMLDPILDEFGAYLRSIELRPPEIPFASNLTGTWITEEEATSPDYWVRHLRNSVRFADGVATLLEEPGRVLLEVGPGRTLSSLARQNEAAAPGQPVQASLRHPEEAVSDGEFLARVLGQLWASGVEIDWSRFYRDERRRRVALPTYAFQPQRYWIDPGEALYAARDEEQPLTKVEGLENWFYRPVWQESEVEAPASEDGPCRWLVFLDSVGVGARLVARLRELGHQVITVRQDDGYFRVGESEFALAAEEGRAGYDALIRDLAESDQLPQRIVHLWTLTADKSARPGSSFFHDIQERGFYSLLFLAQALGERDLSDSLSISVVSNGAQRVASEPLLYPEKATLLGPCKVIPREFPGVRCTHVDVELPQHRGRLSRKRSADGLGALVDTMLAEVLGATGNEVVAYRNETRWMRGYEHFTSPPPAENASRLRDEGVYLITGGLGGIGLVIAQHLARTRRAKLALVGRSPLPARTDWNEWLATHAPGDPTSRKLRQLLELEASGGEVLAISADVAHVEQMGEVVAQVRERFGTIHGVFHAAGTLDDDLIQLKTQNAIEEVFTPKIQGTLVLDSLLGDEALDFTVLFSSASSALGTAGQIDYVAANSFLNAFAETRSADGGPYTVALNWGIWNEVGMAAEAAAGRAEIEDRESLQPATHPLLDDCVARGPEEITYASDYGTRSHWPLDEHRTRAGQAVMPGTGYVELLRAAVAESEGPGPTQIENLSFLAPLPVDDGEAKSVRVAVRKGAAGFAIRVESRERSESWELHAEGEVSRAELREAGTHPLETIRARCNHRSSADPGGIRTGQEDHMVFGPRWRCLREVHWGEREALALLELPSGFERELAEYPLHPALLDQATGFAMELIEGYQGDAPLYVPLSYRRVTMHAPLTTRIVSHVTGAPENHVDKDVARFDVVITDEMGRVLVEVEELAIKKIEATQEFAPRAPLALGDAPEHLSPAERAFRRILAAGILPHEGIAALERLLESDPVPQVIVSSIEFDTLIEQVEAAIPAAAESGAKFSRPNLASEYVGPRDEVEGALVEFWEELLGVDQVGVQDDFFELGGHSLIAVRLFAQIKQRFEVDYPISVLFEAPTIEKCAERIRAEIGERPEGVATSEEAHRFLVPMNAGSTDGQAPFFLVAGMFGNVLNLRHLAALIGSDRSFYAIQALGLRGDEEPHRRFEDMAAAYIEEIRAVQPEGPYLVGGFSGGGITAYEIAQQLTAAGQEVELLVLLDTPLTRKPTLQASEKVQIHLQRLLRQGPSYVTNWARSRIAWEIKKRQPVEFEVESPYEFRSKLIESAFREALGHYEMKPYPGRVALFRPKLDRSHVLHTGRVVDAQREFVFHDNGWAQFVDDVAVHEVPGDHDGMVLEPNVRVLGAKVREAIEDVEAQTRAPA